MMRQSPRPKRSSRSVPPPATEPPAETRNLTAAVKLLERAVRALKESARQVHRTADELDAKIKAPRKTVRRGRPAPL